jgi:hypothetical protein
MAARVNSPSSLISDSSGNIFFVDFVPGVSDGVLRKITQSGNVTTISPSYSASYVITNVSGNFYTRGYVVVNGEGGGV